MAVPKRKVSGAPRDKRRSNNSKLAAPVLVECPKCRELISAHRVCPACGSYGGKEVVKTEKEEKK